MYILDTDVVSELMRPKPTHAVFDWVGSHNGRAMYLTAISEAELRFGAEVMPEGKRRRRLLSIIAIWLQGGFLNEIIPFDSDAAKAYAIIAADLKSRGLPIGEADCRIAAICQSRDATLVTRNVRHFSRTGIDIVNPWEFPGTDQFPSNGGNHRFVPPYVANSHWMNNHTHAN